MARVAWRAAPGSGGEGAPLYGYSVASAGGWTYMFGNTFVHDLMVEPFWGPHSTDALYVARVPSGRLDTVPAYWDGTGWNPDRTRAQAVSKRFSAENPMHPVRLGGRWLAATKKDGWFGDVVVIDEAPAAQGPWRTIETIVAPLRPAAGATNTYHANLLPWTASDGSLLVSLSNNAWDMRAVAYPDPKVYRPSIVKASTKVAVPQPAPSQPPVPRSSGTSRTGALPAWWGARWTPVG
jgi:hypothetical protein